MNRVSGNVPLPEGYRRIKCPLPGCETKHTCHHRDEDGSWWVSTLCKEHSIQKHRKAWADYLDELRDMKAQAETGDQEAKDRWKHGLEEYRSLMARGDRLAEMGLMEPRKR